MCIDSNLIWHRLLLFKHHQTFIRGTCELVRLQNYGGKLLWQHWYYEASSHAMVDVIQHICFKHFDRQNAFDILVNPFLVLDLMQNGFLTNTLNIYPYIGPTLLACRIASFA